MSAFVKTHFPSLTLEGRGVAATRAGRPVFSGADFRVSSGEVLAVTGPNGSGKSSLLRVLAGLLPYSAGLITVDGVCADLHSDTYQEGVCYLGHTDGLKSLLTVWENLAFYSTLRGYSLSRTCIMEAVAFFDLADHVETPVQRLSAGQRRRVALASLVLSPAQLWLLDEPTAALDRSGIQALEMLIQNHCAVGGAVVMSTHEVQFSFPNTLVLGGCESVVSSPRACYADDMV